jgi:hypothetical protein
MRQRSGPDGQHQLGAARAIWPSSPQPDGPAQACNGGQSAARCSPWEHFVASHARMCDPLLPPPSCSSMSERDHGAHADGQAPLKGPEEGGDWRKGRRQRSEAGGANSDRQANGEAARRGSGGRRGRVNACVRRSAIGMPLALTLRLAKWLRVPNEGTHVGGGSEHTRQAPGARDQSVCLCRVPVPPVFLLSLPPCCGKESLAGLVASSGHRKHEQAWTGGCATTHACEEAKPRL